MVVYILQLAGIVLVAAQEAVDNTNNQFCGVSYEDAWEQCRLPPGESLHCANGETDCEAYGLPGLLCFEIDEGCARSQPREEGASGGDVSPSPSLSLRSGNPSDHNFCGLGFDNLLGCAVHCPNGNPAECPSGQLCFFDTICDARYEGNMRPVPTQSPTITPKPVERIPVLSDKNFCGSSYTEAQENCVLSRHCPSGMNDDCPKGMYCFVDVNGCDANQLPTMRPTISPKPTFTPSLAPTTRNPSWTPEPTQSPLERDDIRNFFFCGVDWGDASTRCYKRCLSGEHFECPEGEKCFAQAGCRNGVLDNQPPAPAPKKSPAPNQSPFPTPTPIETDEPTHSPLEKDDFRNFFFCGTSWGDATERCYKRCLSGHHIECPGDEECFAQADCKKGVIEQKTKNPTEEPTPMPMDGTRSPTISPAPTNSPTNPQPTESPVPPPTLSPALVPTESPTTPQPTNKPTYATCGGEPCANKEYCRSNQGFCGPGEGYCNAQSIWTASCGVPTDPPVSSAPTTIWPSMSPSFTSRPTKVGTKPPTDSPTKLSDMVYHLNSDHPTLGEAVKSEAETSSPTHENVDDRYYEPGDPLGTFFCGTDWNHAITECPHRCPSGESDQCPKGWSCYAFTSCVGIGINTPPTAKPTWEPTKKPTPKPTKMPTDMPITAQQSWSEKNEELYGGTPTTPTRTRTPALWTPQPTPKPSFAPTEDQCRGLPCDFEGECRSRLGFCGTGIVYCNSASSWIPSCGGGGAKLKLQETVSPNTVPTISPSSAWQAWVGQQNEEKEGGAVASDSDGVGSSNGAGSDDSGSSESKGDTWSGFDPDTWGSWGKEEGASESSNEPEDFRWWTTPRSSSTRKRGSLPIMAVCWWASMALIHRFMH